MIRLFMVLVLMVTLLGCIEEGESMSVPQYFVDQSEVLGIDMSQNTKGFIIPLYLYPTDDYSEYERIMNVKETYPELPVIVIINPHNGPGDEDENYTNLVKDLHESDITMIGYIYASYGKRSLLEIENDISRFEELYPEIKGYFLDEVDDGGNYNYYNSVRKLLGDREFIVGNPGTFTEDEYFNVFDVLVISEMRYDDITEDWLKSRYSQISPAQKSVISYATIDELAALWITNSINWIYITEYDVYTKLPLQFEELARQVDELNRG